MKAGTAIVIADQQNTVTSTNTLVVTRAGADTIVSQGTTVNTFTLFTAGANVTLISDGVSKWNVIACKMGVNVRRLLSGSAATYTATVGCTRQCVTMWAGGGGGGAQATNNGTNGGTSSFQVNSTGTAWTCIGGTGGTNGGGSVQSGTGGTGGTTGAGTLVHRADGSTGGASWTGAGAQMPGIGGTAFGAGQGGTMSVNPAAGTNAPTNSGGGGSGAFAAGTGAGGGGGGGEYVEFWVTGMTTATYTVGAAGAGGAAGTRAGGNGAAGAIIVEEFFD